jgi:hypothetical protein
LHFLRFQHPKEDAGEKAVCRRKETFWVHSFGVNKKLTDSIIVQGMPHLTTHDLAYVWSRCAYLFKGAWVLAQRCQHTKHGNPSPPSPRANYTCWQDNQTMINSLRGLTGRIGGGQKHPHQCQKPYGQRRWWWIPQLRGYSDSN